MEDTGILCVYCTCPDEGVAQNLAEQLVTNHLAACVTIIPAIQSVYRWNGKVERETEAQLVIKCAEHAWSEIHDFVLSEHPHENPELLAVPVVQGSAAYIDWVNNECAPPQPNRH